MDAMQLCENIPYHYHWGLENSAVSSVDHGLIYGIGKYKAK